MDSQIKTENRVGLRVAHTLAAAVLCLTPALTPALAADWADVETNTVKVKNLAVSTTSDAMARRMLRRLDDAAIEACGASQFSLPDMKAAIRGSRCWKESVADAVGRIGNPHLTAAFARER